MGKHIEQLTDKQIRALRPRDKSYQVTDGRGLYVEVLPTGGKSFRFQYRLGGKKEKVVIGDYTRGVSLAMAREKHAALMEMVARGESPARQIRQAKETKRAELSGASSFRGFATAWLDAWKSGKAPRSVVQVRAWLENDVFPLLGEKPVAEIRSADILDVLDAVKKRAPPSARKIHGYLRQVFDHAINRLVIESNPVDRIRPASLGKIRSRDRALSPQEIVSVFRAIDAAPGREQTKLAFRLLLLTLVRKSELLTARWEHIDLERGEWVIPPASTKTRKAHWVPLAPQAVEALARLRVIGCGEPYVLPHQSRSNGHMSGSALNEMLARLRRGSLGGVEPFTVHDLRRTAATRLSEAGFAGDWIERALNHELPGVRGVYVRAEFREQRRAMLAQWAVTVDAWLAGRGVLPFKARA